MTARNSHPTRTGRSRPVPPSQEAGLLGRQMAGDLLHAAATLLQLASVGLRLATSLVADYLLGWPAQALESIGQSVRILPDGHIKVPNPPLHGDLVSRKQDIKPVALDRAPDIKDGNDRAVVISRNTEKRTQGQDLGVRRDEEPAIREDRVAARGDSVGAVATTPLVGAVGRHAHPKRVRSADRTTVVRPRAQQVGADAVSIADGGTRSAPTEPTREQRSGSPRGAGPRDRTVGIAGHASGRTQGRPSSGDSKRHQPRSEGERKSRRQHRASTDTQRLAGCSLTIQIEIVGCTTHRSIRPKSRERMNSHMKRAGARAPRDRIHGRGKSTAAACAFTILIAIRLAAPPSSGSSCGSAPRGGPRRGLRGADRASCSTGNGARSCLGTRLPRWSGTGPGGPCPVRLPVRGPFQTGSKAGGVSPDQRSVRAPPEPR